MSYKAEAVRAAKRILAEEWGSHIPVDPARIARGLGIEVLDAQLDPNVSGALVKEPDRDPSILINWMDGPNRKRFTCAHEVGHFVRHSERPDRYEYVDFRGELASRGYDADEIYANTFAAALLMPEEHIRRFMDAGLDEVQMATRFGVSREAMHNRLADLRLDG